MGFCMALSMNPVGIPGGFRGSAGFSGNLDVWGGFGRFGASKGFCANSQPKQTSRPLPNIACFRKSRDSHRGLSKLGCPNAVEKVSQSNESYKREHP